MIAGGAGTTTSSITVTALGDDIDEEDQTVVISLATTDAVTGDMPTVSNASLTVDGILTTSYTLTITDTDLQPAVNFLDVSDDASTSNSVTEAAGTVTFYIGLDAASSEKDITVYYTITKDSTDEGYGYTTGHASSTTWPADYYYSDFDLTERSLTISAGDKKTAVTLNINDDGIDEPNEEVQFTISDGTGGTTPPTNASVGSDATTHTITITDDDAAPTINFSTSTSGSAINENDAGTVNFTDYVELDAISGKDIQFSYTTEGGNKGDATVNSDYTPAVGKIGRASCRERV